MSRKLKVLSGITKHSLFQVLEDIQKMPKQKRAIKDLLKKTFSLIKDTIFEREKHFLHRRKIQPYDLFLKELRLSEQNWKKQEKDLEQKEQKLLFSLEELIKKKKIIERIISRKYNRQKQSQLIQSFSSQHKIATHNGSLRTFRESSLRSKTGAPFNTLPPI